MYKRQSLAKQDADGVPVDSVLLVHGKSTHDIDEDYTVVKLAGIAAADAPLAVASYAVSVRALPAAILRAPGRHKYEATRQAFGGRGRCQGSSEGPLGWRAFYDILLSMQDRAARDHGGAALVEGGESPPSSTTGLCFVDDALWLPGGEDAGAIRRSLEAARSAVEELEDREHLR